MQRWHVGVLSNVLNSVRLHSSVNFYTDVQYFSSTICYQKKNDLLFLGVHMQDRFHLFVSYLRQTTKSLQSGEKHTMYNSTLSRTIRFSFNATQAELHQLYTAIYSILQLNQLNLCKCSCAKRRSGVWSWNLWKKLSHKKTHEGKVSRNNIYNECKIVEAQ